MKLVASEAQICLSPSAETMSRKKLKKILAVDALPNVFLPPVQGDEWLHEFFGNHRPFTLEIGCGRGDYAIRLAQAFPHRNFVGVDVKGARLWTGVHAASALGVQNVVFLRAKAEELDVCFRNGEVEEIWIPFPDPFPKKKGRKRRVTSPAFLDVYHKILRPGGKVHLKTDDPAFFEFTLETLWAHKIEIVFCSDDIYAAGLAGAVTQIKTKYEERHLAEGKKIKYVSFRFEV